MYNLLQQPTNMNYSDVASYTYFIIIHLIVLAILDSVENFSLHHFQIVDWPFQQMSQSLDSI